MGKKNKNKNKKANSQQGSDQNPPTGNTQSNQVAKNIPVEQGPQTQAAGSNEVGQNSSMQQAPQQKTTWSNVTGQNMPTQQPPPQKSAGSNVAAKQTPQQKTAWSNVASQNLPTQQPHQQKTAWSNVPCQNLPTQQPPQQKTALSNVASQNLPTQQSPQQKTAWSNVTSQNFPTQQPSPQKSAWSNVARQNAPTPQPSVQQAPPQKSNVGGQQLPQQKSSRSNGTEQNAPVQQASAQVLAQQLSDMHIAGQEAGGDASAKKPVENKRKLEDAIATRPPSCTSKHGTTGDKIMLLTNYFEVLKRADWCLYQYRVDIAPTEERTFIRKALLRVHQNVLGAYLFDGTMLFCSNRLPSNNMELQSIRNDRTPMKITIKLTGDLARGDHHYLQLFNILVRKCLEHLKLQLVGRNYFDMDAGYNVRTRDYNLELWPGYLTSIRQHDSGILMCAEISHKVMRVDTLHDILRKLVTECPERYRSEFETMVLGTIVLTTYNNRTYRIDDVDWNSNLNTTFDKNGEKVRFADYYLNRYEIRIRDMKQPLLMSRMSQRQRRAGENEFLYLVPELCRATGLTDKMKDNTYLMKALGEHTKLSPESRITKLMYFNNRLLSTQDVVTEFKRWDFQLNNRLVELQGRVLSTKLLAGKNQLIVPKYNDWNFDMQKKAFFKTLALKDWCVIIPRPVSHEATAFINAMIASGNKMSFAISQPRKWFIDNDRPIVLVDAMEQLVKHGNWQIIMCIISSNHLGKYSAIKKKACVDRPIPSQVVLIRTLNQRNPNMLATVSSKVAMQIGCKIGCVPWSVNIAQDARSDVMSVGFDVCHDKTREGADFGAMVASIDPSNGIYFSSVSNHASGEELSNDLSLKLEQACLAYKNRNQKLPGAIIIYRDGVGEGQVPFVYHYELKRIVQTLNRYYKNENKILRLSFIIVTKRINTRLFSRSSSTGKMENPPSGTVVDSVITDPLKYDFFLVSQSAREGTVSPTSYNVIYDSTGLTADAMQLITYKLCHMYFNFTGGIRVPAPCQFAHKLAFFVSKAVHERPSERLQQLLYFI